MYGAPDVVVVNVTKDAIWHRDAALPGFAGQSLPNPTILFGDPLPVATGRGIVPQPKLPGAPAGGIGFFALLAGWAAVIRLLGPSRAGA